MNCKLFFTSPAAGANIGIGRFLHWHLREMMGWIKMGCKVLTPRYLRWSHNWLAHQLTGAPSWTCACQDQVPLSSTSKDSVDHIRRHQNQVLFNCAASRCWCILILIIYHLTTVTHHIISHHIHIHAVLLAMSSFPQHCPLETSTQVCYHFTYLHYYSEYLDLLPLI